MNLAKTSTLLTLVDSADVDGRVRFLVPSTEPMRTQAHAREWLLAILAPLVTLKLDRVKKAITEVDLVLTPTESRTVLGLNLAKLLLLPGVAPVEELAAFRALLVELKAFFEAHPTERCDIQLCNNRDRNRRVYGSISCRVCGPERASPDEARTAAVRARIDADPALTHWLKQVALALQKIGPWASAFIREEDLFGCIDGPYMQHIRKQVVTAPRLPPEQVYPLDI